MSDYPFHTALTPLHDAVAIQVQRNNDEFFQHWNMRADLPDLEWELVPIPSPVVKAS